MSSLKSQLMSSAKLLLAKHRSQLSGSYASFAAALAATGDDGYENSRIPALIVERTARFAAALAALHESAADETRLVMYGALQAAAATASGPISVIDFGGACGAHFYLARRYLPQREWRWCVVETAAMAAAGSKSAPPQLSFVSSVRAAVAQVGVPDLVYSNNAVQYAPDPLAQLDELLAQRARITCISKLALARVSATLFTRQASMLSDNGPGPVPAGFADSRVVYPLGILPLEPSVARLRAAGMLSVHYVHPNMLYHRDCGLIEYHSFISSRAAATPAGDAR